MTKFIFNYTNYFLFLMFFFFILFLFINLNNHPIMIMIILLMFSSLICLNMSLWKLNYILSIFLFLMMISGLLIMFLYFSSLISNEQFKFKMNSFFLIFFFINVYIFSIYFVNVNSLNNLMFIYKYKFHENSTFSMINLSNFHNILSLYEYPLNNLTILSMFFLLLSLFIIIKICSLKLSTSMRKIN